MSEVFLALVSGAFLVLVGLVIGYFAGRRDEKVQSEEPLWRPTWPIPATIGDPPIGPPPDRPPR